MIDPDTQYEIERDSALEDAGQYYIISDDAGVILDLYGEADVWRAHDAYAEAREAGRDVYWHSVSITGRAIRETA